MSHFPSHRSRLPHLFSSLLELSLIRDFSRHVKHLPFPSEHTKGLQTRFGEGVGRGEINSKKLHLDLFTDTAEEEKNRELDLMHLLLSEVIYSGAEGIWKIILSNPVVRFAKLSDSCPLSTFVSRNYNGHY
ncbi:hypothetical protein TNCT_41451 [Trichonephila clavata]|uniref:Uncharacterized protein n=1 Tax=Trichonephila clavata TaxID=2740835 RepID=A0A8X6GKN0_TRICU|nr:hypothetical protein TNCT_41451 [Trichonephila clavata]